MTIYNYFPNIPNPPDAPADDVASMQTNSASIAGLIGVDHVGFGVSGNGQHKQVTFNGNNVPGVFPVSPPVLFTQNDASNLPQLFFYSGSAVRSSNQYTAAGSGSVLLLGGIIIKWGTWSLAPNVLSASVTFANAFPNNVFALTFGSNVTGPVATNLPVYSNLTPTGFTGQRQINNNSGTYQYFYIAIGN
jgi:hypothetical protein